MNSYKTPNVYIEEIAKASPSVAEVSTAFPAFMGYTEKAEENGKNLIHIPTRINNFLEYQEYFGGPAHFEFLITASEATETVTIDSESTLKYILYHSLEFYFSNGGGPCMIISTGNYSENPSKEDYISALNALSKQDEPTLILLTDAIYNVSKDDYYELVQIALAQCENLKDRFTILDVLSDDKDGSEFRQGIGTENLKYGAAYYPFLITDFKPSYTEESVQITLEFKPTTTESGNIITPLPEQMSLGDFVKVNNALYEKAKTLLNQQSLILPPSPSMAGIYAQMDRNYGVWRPPANINVASVVDLTAKLDNQAQEAFNIDAASGKSINIIRSFKHEGIAVWGARTLAGNDNNWRYISVRRLFNNIEVSIRQATRFAVFEPNNATTWIKVKAMIDSYLYGLWKQRALLGQTRREAYFVNIGLGSSMTQQDILEGRLNVDIGIAAVRPAEFIILKFSHKLQESISS